MSFDAVACVIIGTTLVVSFMRGFIKETLNLLSFLGTIYLTYKLSGSVAELFADVIPSKLIARVVAGFLVYLVSTAVFAIIKRYILKFCGDIRLGLADRIFGLLLGFIKGLSLSLLIYLSIVIVYPVLYPPDDNTDQPEEGLIPEWLAESRLHPVFGLLKDAVEQLLPEDFLQRLDKDFLHKKNGLKDG
ncbi:hypothetical protein RLOatenuis_4420 [Rickettsiales bacterium]|nr:hypothetical protein RLOatenuis_4420 [Rickettsiales bacterium]